MHPIKRLTTGEAAYIAGIIDGEGTVTLTRTPWRAKAPDVGPA